MAPAVPVAVLPLIVLWTIVRLPMTSTPPPYAYAFEPSPAVQPVIVLASMSRLPLVKRQPPYPLASMPLRIVRPVR